ncbi:hypothetical protein CYMTET_52415 [Cymbomonas tetramitiformis]|uniref:Uncharacterized protein n=1 Tax=Cymbomonas tetramitiformis TaxID=36881 RepID=A0AAE0EQU0_9CHLO|nr:hypothetical protein CYMTET_52415 [Cymbomonas tetramitiformis]
MESIQEAYDFVKRAEVLIDELNTEAGLTADALAEIRGQTEDYSTQPSKQDAPSHFFYNEAPNVVNVAHKSQLPTFENLTACSKENKLFINTLTTFRSEEHHRHAAEGSAIRQVRAGSIHVVPGNMAAVKARPFTGTDKGGTRGLQ